MSIVVIENNDCRIWHRDRVIIDIMSAIALDQDIELSLNIEGPCANSLGLYNLLDAICEKTNYSFKRFTIHTCNLKEQHSRYRVIVSAPSKHVKDLQQRTLNNPVEFKKITANTKRFGCFVGHANRARLTIASHLWTFHNKDVIQTYHFDPMNDYQREFASVNEMILNNYDWEQVIDAVTFLQQGPIKYDPITYPIISSTHSLDKMFAIEHAYKDFFVDISCQTYYTGNTFYLDEKIWRAVINRTPFIVQGPVNFIKNLQILGFKTFGAWWDESYSEDPPDYQVQCVINQIDKLSKLSTNDIQTMYEEMKPVLEHNYNHFLTLQDSDYFKTYL